MAGSPGIYMVRLEGRFSSHFDSIDADDVPGVEEALALHEGFLEVPDALGPCVGVWSAKGTELILDAALSVEASSFGEAANRAVAAYRAAALFAGLGSASSISEGATVVSVEVHTEEEFDRRMMSGA